MRSLHRTAAADPLPPSSPARPRDLIGQLLHLGEGAAPFWRVGLGLFLAGATVVLVLDATRPSFYRSEAMLRVLDGAQLAMADGDRAFTAATQQETTLRALLLTRTRLEKIRGELHLPMVGPDPVEEMRARTRLFLHETTVTLSYDAQSPALAQAATARLAEGLAGEMQAGLRSRILATRDFLRREATRSEEDLRTHELSLARFVRRNGDALMRGSGRYLSMMAASLPGAREGIEAPGTRPRVLGGAPDRRRGKRRRHASARAQATRPLPTVAAAPAPPAAAPLHGAQDEAQKRAERELTESILALSRERSSKTDQHPDVISAERRLERAEAAFAQATSSEALSLAPPTTSPQAATAPTGRPAPGHHRRRRQRGHAAAIHGQPRPMVEARAAVRSSVDLLAEWARLRRELAESAERHEGLARRLFHVEMIAAAPPDQIAVLDPASLPTTSINRRVEPILSGLLASLALAFGAMWLLGQHREARRRTAAVLYFPTVVQGGERAVSDRVPVALGTHAPWPSTSTQRALPAVRRRGRAKAD